MKSNILLIQCLAITSLFNCYGNSLNVLVVKVSATRSHNNLFGGIIDALLQNNHTVTFISMFALEEKKNLNQVIIESTNMDEIFGNVFEISTTKIMRKFANIYPEMCMKDLVEPKVQEAVKMKFDIAILSMYMTTCFLSVVHKQQIPFIYASTLSLIPPYTDYMGDLYFPSVTPQKMLAYSHPLSFKERLIGTMVDLLSTASNFYSLSLVDRICREREFCPPDMPPLSEISKTASLAFVNSVRTLEIPVKTAVPSIIYVGGIHIKPPKPLPKDIQQWIDESGEDGVIYFSLGTAAVPSKMKKEHYQIIMKVFGSLKQRILWKHNLDRMEGLPSNIKLSKWFPQQDILAHPKTRVFITHGGLFSTQEAMYYGVPVIGMPIFVDQFNNIAQVEMEGWGVKLNWDNLTEESFRKIIHTALNDPKLRNISRKRSEIMKDEPVSPSVTANYWVEYVVRHHGAKHLRSPFIDMPWYKVYNVDAWVLIITINIVILIAILKLLKLLFNIFKRIIFYRKMKKE